MLGFFTDIIKRNYSNFIKMADLSDLKKNHTVGARMAGASTIKTIELFDVARSTASKVMAVRRKNLLTEAKIWKKAKDVL